MSRFEPTVLAAQIRRIAPGDALADAELVGRYAEHRDAAAFEVLVWRHGPMVWATARRVLRHQQDIEDVFQATFLALARAAGSLGTRQAVAGWRHRVAVNTSVNLKARRTTVALPDVPAPPEPDGELPGAVDEELERLPARMRVAFVLCCLEGMTSAEAARELGCPVGTVDSRLHAARNRLRERLTKRGLAPAVVLVGLSPCAAAVPAPSVAIALHYGAHPASAPIKITLLATGALKAMSASKLKTAALLLAALLAGSGLALSMQPKGVPATPQKEAPVIAANPPKLAEEWSKAVNSLQARVVLVEKAPSNGTRILHPYLELRSVSDSAYPLKVRLDGAHVKFELVDADGKVVEDNDVKTRDGPHPDPGTVSLPPDSTMRVNMYCTNWGVPKDAAAQIATDSGAWVLKPEQAGKVFLRATISGKKAEDERVWFGELQAKVRVTWGEVKPEEPKLSSWSDLLNPHEVAAGEFEKWKEAAEKDKNPKGIATFKFTRIEFEKKVFWVSDAHYGDGVAYKSIAVYAPEKDGSFRRVVVADSNRAGSVGVEFDPKTGALEVRNKLSGELKDAVILSCNLKTVGTAYSTGVAP